MVSYRNLLNIVRWIVKEWMISDSLWHHYWISINNVEDRCIFPLDQRVRLGHVCVCVGACPRSSYLIRDAPMVIVPHTDPHWTLNLIRGSPGCLVTLPIWAHLHIFMDNACETQTCKDLRLFSGIYVLEKDSKTGREEMRHAFGTRACPTH